jgi:predicted RNA methylase
MDISDFPFNISIDDEIRENKTIQSIVNTLPLENTRFIAPYVPISKSVAKHSIEIANLTLNDTMIDLGCGDGRLLELALKYCNNVIGVELDPLLIEYMRSNNPKYQIIESDMFSIDLIALNVNVIILYLLPKGLEKLIPNLRKWIKSGDGYRIVTAGYSIPGIKECNCSKVLPDDGFMGGANEPQSVYYYNKSCF